ncbi:MAG: hypothetical protein SFT91_04085 [Rickettsiaceae bacterium]|nr:hypothetical protein [Rickettsiaceae bacterium]
MKLFLLPRRKIFVVFSPEENNTLNEEYDTFKNVSLDSWLAAKYATIFGKDLYHSVKSQFAGANLSNMLKLCNMMYLNPQIMQLDLSENCLTEASIGYLSEALLNLPSIIRLNLSFNDFSTTSMSYLSNTLAKNIALEELSLNQCNINHDGLNLLFKALNVNTNLTGISLMKNNIDSGIIKKLANDTNGINVCSLILAYNPLGNESARYIYKIIDDSRNLSVVHLEGTEITHNFINVIKKACNAKYQEYLGHVNKAYDSLSNPEGHYYVKKFCLSNMMICNSHNFNYSNRFILDFISCDNSDIEYLIDTICPQIATRLKAELYSYNDAISADRQKYILIKKLAKHAFWPYEDLKTPEQLEALSVISSIVVQNAKSEYKLPLSYLQEKLDIVLNFACSHLRTSLILSYLRDIENTFDEKTFDIVDRGGSEFLPHLNSMNIFLHEETIRNISGKSNEAPLYHSDWQLFDNLEEYAD